MYPNPSNDTVGMEGAETVLESGYQHVKMHKEDKRMQKDATKTTDTSEGY